MRRQKTTAAVLILTAVLNGCSATVDQFVGQYGGLIAANPLDPVITIPATSKGQEPTILDPRNFPLDDKGYKADTISYVVLETFSSLLKCKKLLDSQGIVSRGIDADLDLITTVLTALATAFSPISTVHIFTAAALISSGWKNVLDSDLYAKKTSDIIATQIDTSYFSAMTKYVSGFTDRVSKGRTIYPQLEFLQIALYTVIAASILRWELWLRKRRHLPTAAPPMRLPLVLRT